jgi:hypothetical protein
VIGLLIEFLLPAVVEFLLGVFSHTLGRDSRGRLHPVFGLLALAFLGAVAGGLATWLLPQRLLGARAIPGASLVLSPLLNGLFMHYYGSWQARRCGHESLAASFTGGAVLAFGFAFVRFLLLVEP